MNLLGVIFWYFTFSLAAGNGLNISDIRLVNGSVPYGGRVEIKINGIWGTVCDESFDFRDAKVMCKMMNLKASTYMAEAWYGKGIGPIFAQEFKCWGHESHLKYCSYVPNVQCTHARDIGIICSECSDINISNGYGGDISADGSVLSAICKNGFKSNATTSVCNSGIWSPPSIICKHDFKGIRLVNGIGLYDGRVELLVNGTWGTICSTDFSYTEAYAICNIIFGTNDYRTYRTSSSSYGPGTGPIHIDNLDCAGFETDINECSYSLDISCTDHSRDAAVACNVQRLNITATRLVNGTGPYDGRVELNVDGYWGTICNRFIDTFDAQTICSTHNASLAAFFTKTIYGKGTGPVLIYDIICNSHRDHINECRIQSPYRTYCTHDYDLSIVCTPCGVPKIYNGEAVSFNNTELTVKCQKGFYPVYIKMRCTDNGSWVENQRCTSYYDYPLNISEIRLRNSYGYSHQGRVELLVNGTWGTVCDTGFDSKNAAVLCRMLHLRYKSYYINAGSFGKGSGTIFVNSLQCNGTERHINYCTYEISNYCTHYDDVGVVCTGYQLNITDIRLAGTNGPYHGRVELKVNGTWGTMCHNYLYSNEARVLCRMLGLVYKSYYHNAKYGHGSGPIYLDRLDCPYSATHINECTYDTNNNYNCDHDDDASVMCYGSRLNITDARLVDGTGPYDGRAEIKVADTWGTICDENFDILDADYFCRKLGLRAAEFYTGAFYGEGRGPVFIDQLFCEKHDYDLSNCKYLFLNEWTHERDVSVVGNECGLKHISEWDAGFWTSNGETLHADCSFYKTYIGTLKLMCNKNTQTWVTEGECQEYTFPLNITDIRLTDGSRSTQGRVEIKSLNTCGTICDNNFGISEANLICKMVGYTRAVSFYAGAFYGEGKGPIFADKLVCKDNSIDFNDCTYTTYHDCTHGNDISVVCTGCGEATPKHGFVNTTATTYQTVAHVTCDKGYKLIGDEYIICQANATWSNRPVCKLIDCGNATPKNGFVNTLSTTYQSVVHVTCNKGYKIVGEEYITCQANATWSNRPVCKLIDCGDPTPVHGSSNISATTNGSVALIVCETGYTLIGKSVITCQPDETWTGTPSCVIKDCRDATPKNGFVNTSSTTYQTAVHVTCKKGYKLIGEENIICQPNATWSNRPVCKLIDCGDPTPVHGSSNSSVTTNGTIALIECASGYTMIGKSIVTCQQDEKWTDTPSCVINDCGDATPKNGFVNTLSTTYQSVVHVTCSEGYKLIGKEYITCQPNATWSDRPVCQLIDCGDPTPVHGSSNSSVTTNGTAALITCQTGYTMIGESIITCQSNGAWTGTPSCVINDCGDATPKNGFVNTLSTTYQSVVHVTCNEDYKLIGKEYIICQANATWSDRPLCKLIDCGDPTPVHGSSNSSVTKNGTVALIECEKGYTMIGESSIACQSNGAWTGTPSCVINEEADGDDSDKVIIILAVCMGILAVAVIGLVIVKVFRKRNSNSKKIEKNTAAAGTKARIDKSNDDPTDNHSTNIQQTSTERDSEANVYEIIGEQDVQQISMKHLDYDMLTLKKEHELKPDNHTLKTNETHFYENVPSSS